MKKARILALLAAPLVLSACGEKDGDTSKKNPAATGTSPGNGSNTTTTPTSADGSCLTQPGTTLRLAEDETLAQDLAKVEAVIKERTPQGFTVSVTKAYRNAAGVDASHFELTQYFDGVPLCGYHGKAYVVGSEVTAPFFAAFTAPADLSEAAYGTPEGALATAAASMNLAGANLQVRGVARCLQPVGAELFPAFDLMATIGNAPYRVIGNSDAAFAVESQSLHMAATATIYKRNVLEASMTDVPVEVSRTGALDTPTLRVIDASGAVIGPTAVDGKLTPAANSAAFQEVSLFAHVQEQFAYDLQFRSLSDSDCMPIEIAAHSADDGPVYLPSWNQTTGHPRIVVPDAIAGTLRNLSTDYDAVAHETNHHFIYQRLKSLSFEPSKVIHEGLADYFVFAHTGDSCLAESICVPDPANKLCVVNGKCLRSGDVAVSQMKFYTDAYTAAPYHKKSQALSGLLLAIGKEPTVGADTIAKVMFSAIDFLKEKSEIGDWLEAVLQGDKATFKGAHACVILAKAKDFGLTAEAAGIDCKSYVVP